MLPCPLIWDQIKLKDYIKQGKITEGLVIQYDKMGIV